MEEILRTIAVWALPVLFAITLHEAAHGYVARHFGDTTAYVLGRVSLNPLRHIDPIGTIAVPIGILALTSLTQGPGIIFGWAKPVPVNFGNLRRPKRDMLWVAAAGPGANFLMALMWAVVFKFAASFPFGAGAWLTEVGQAGVQINVVLMVLNLLPIPPLDGGRIAVSLLPSRAAYRYSMIEPYGIMILLALLLTGLLGRILWPFVSAVEALISILFGI